MKKWVVKALVQKATSYLPFSHKINYVFQKYITKGVHLSDEYFFDRLGHARDHIKAYSECSGKKYPLTSLELGTGWHPVVPLSLFLVGANEIYSVDNKPLISRERIYVTISKILDADDAGVLKKYIPYKSERMQQLRHVKEEFKSYSTEQIFEKLNLKYLIGDARTLMLQDSSVDLVNSNNTFEHIYPEILIPILKEFKRVANKRQGVMSHFIDMSDHFAHFDKTITIYNFLKYSDKEWSLIDNSIQPQNRLRIDDYWAIYRKLGIAITKESFRKGNVEEVASLDIDKRFRSKTDEMIAVSHCHFISRMNDSNEYKAEEEFIA